MASDGYELRFADEGDAAAVYGLIVEFSRFVGSAEQCEASLEKLTETVFRRKQAEILLARRGDEAVGYCAFFQCYSTWLTRAGLFIEDLFVREGHRRAGLGGLFFRRLGEICRERDYGRIEWHCRDWNRNAIDFYLGMGATRVPDSGVYRLDGDALAGLDGTLTPR